MSLSPSEEVSRDVTGDVVIIVPSNNNNCVQTVVAIDSDSEHAANDSSGNVKRKMECHFVNFKKKPQNSCHW